MRRPSVIFAFSLLCLTITGCECGDPDPTDGGRFPDGFVPDGAVRDGGMVGPTVTICPGDSLPPLSGAICEATAGDGNMLITADVLTPGEVFRGGHVLIAASGSIACVGCDCSGQAEAAAATTVVCPNGVISPGMINAHEHISFRGNPYPQTAERYEHRNDWRKGHRGHTRVSAGGSINDNEWHELRMVMSGVTSVVGHFAGSTGLVRNLDVGTQLESLSQPEVESDTFPLDDRDNGELIEMGCTGYMGLPNGSSIAMEAAYIPHVAEGIDRAARNEFACLREGASDIVEPNVAFIHGVGLLAPDIAEMAQEQTSLIWSPRTNITLYGDTARVTLYDNLGVLIAMGTDWQRSGSMNMLRELRCADDFNQDYLNGYFNDESLWLMATRNGAVVMAMNDAIGTIATGLVADLAIYDGSMNVDHRAILDAEPEDVALVLRGGQVLYGEESVVSVLESGCDSIDVCGSQRAACLSREVGMSFSALSAANTPDGYELFSCGGATPDNEPSCIPERNAMGSLPNPVVNGSTRYTGMIGADDLDGDGVLNAADICPNIFNPVRPVDNGAQADFDADGLGDECDPCPLDADTTSCTAIDPNDRDRDMVLDTMDNCPSLANTDQADRDGDMIGDVCDACPDDANPAGSACPATIYDVKDGTQLVGARVLLSQSVVTGVTDIGFTMQVPTDHPDYVDANFSGVFVFIGFTPPPQLSDGTPITRGMTVDVEGEIQLFGGGQIQIASSVITMSATSSAEPPATAATPAEVDTGGARADALEGVTVIVSSVTVTDIAPMETRTGAGAMNEFEVDASLRVDDFFFVLEPFALDGENFNSVTGVMLFRNDRHKLNARDASDYVAGAAQLAGFSPASPAITFARQGAGLGNTFPEVLMINLTRATSTPTTITVTSGDTNLVVANVLIPAMSASAPVPVDAGLPGTYTLTASLTGDMDTADVRVLGATEAPTMFTISPASPPDVGVLAASSQLFTITLDVPAPPAGAQIDFVDTTTGGALTPSPLVIVADAQVGTFTYTAGAAETTGTLTSSLMGTAFSTVTSLVVVTEPGTLVINELDYDQPGEDLMEFVELHNPGTTAADLSGATLYLVNGASSMTDYEAIDLSTAGASLPAGGYIVIGTSALLATVTPGPSLLTIPFSRTSNNVQNGPDCIAVYDATGGMFLDALSYEGEVSGTAGGIPVNCVEGPDVATAVESNSAPNRSMVRTPNGSDTDVATVDFAESECITPGAENMYCG